MSRSRTGLLVIRAWVERGADAPLRAQISLTNDVATGLQHRVTTAHADAVSAVVRAWLADLVGDPAEDTEAPQ